jgi:phosphoribosylamine--glycine ligase
MGAITGPTVLDQPTLRRIASEIVEPTLKGASDEGFPIRGILFVGLMLTAAGPRVLEYNVRFGDPETQAILMRLESDLFKIFQATIAGNLRELEVKWSDQASACVVLASAGYPGSYKTGVKIKGLNKIAQSDELQIFHAGTSRSPEGEVVTSGGRVLGVTAAAATLDRALSSCYGAIATLGWEGMQFRRDIGQFKENQKASSSEFEL